MPKCKACGESYTWMKTKKGKNIPVDDGSFVVGEEVYNPTVMSCHFETCVNGWGRNRPSNIPGLNPGRELLKRVLKDGLTIELRQEIGAYLDG